MKETEDPFLVKRLVKYDEWLGKGLISFSSKVVPVSESLAATQWVLPTEQATGIIRDARSVAVQNCMCRSHYKRCDNPLEVCLVLNEPGEKFVAKGMARPVSLDEATAILRQANESGLVHLGLYMPDHEIFALCSCCSCCCHDFQIVKLFQRKDLMVRSEYVAATDMDACILCGECAGRCPFGARVFEEEAMSYDPARCLGCGLCVTVCPAGATTMEARKPQAG
jgi:ferredoxin